MFKDNLEALPVAQGEYLILLDASGVEAAVIANAPGTVGSFRVYAYLAEKHGTINSHAALEGLEIYAEHTDDARLNPGKHTNIDRLFGVLSGGQDLTARIE